MADPAFPTLSSSICRLYNLDDVEQELTNVNDVLAQDRQAFEAHQKRCQEAESPNSYACTAAEGLSGLIQEGTRSQQTLTELKPLMQKAADASKELATVDRANANEWRMPWVSLDEHAVNQRAKAAQAQTQSDKAQREVDTFKEKFGPCGLPNDLVDPSDVAFPADPIPT